MPRSFDEPALTPDQRRREIARILAKGILRLHCMARGAPESSQSKPATPPDKGVDVSATSRPHETTG